MGNPNSKGQTKAKIAQYDPNVEVLRILDDPNYGRVKLVRENGSQNQMIMKEYVYDTKQAYEKDIKFFEDRIGFNHENIVKIIGFNAKSSQKYCSTFYKASVFIEILTKDLDTELKERTRRRSAYTEGELLLMAENMVAANSFLQSENFSHGDIRPINIFVYSQSYILTDPNLEVDKNSNALIKAIIKKEKTLLSPQLLALVPEGKFENQISKHKSDVFSLGATLLAAATLTNSEDFYDYQAGRINEPLLNERLELVRGQYSGFTYNLLRDMLEIDEERRPDFLELNQRIEPYREAIRDRDDLTRVFATTYERNVHVETHGETKKKAAALPSDRSQQRTNVLQSHPLEDDVDDEQRGVTRGETEKRAGVPSNRSRGNVLQSHPLEDDDEDQVIASERTQQKTDRHNASLISHQYAGEIVDRKGEFYSPEELELQIKKAIERSQNTYKIVKALDSRQELPSSQTNIQTYELSQGNTIKAKDEVEPFKRQHSYNPTKDDKEGYSGDIYKREDETVKRSVPETKVEQPYKSEYSDLVQEIMKKYQTPSAEVQQESTSNFYQPVSYNAGTDYSKPIETSYKPASYQNVDVRQSNAAGSYDLKKSNAGENQTSNIDEEVKRIMETYGKPSQTSNYSYTTSTTYGGVGGQYSSPFQNTGDNTQTQTYQPYVPQTTNYQTSYSYGGTTNSYATPSYGYGTTTDNTVKDILADLKKSQGNQNVLKSSYGGAAVTDTYKPSSYEYQVTTTTQKTTPVETYGTYEGLRASQTGTTSYGNTYTVKPIETYTYTTSYNIGNEGKYQPGAVLAEAESALSRYTPTPAREEGQGQGQIGESYVDLVANV